jgi:hypothetical protein
MKIKSIYDEEKCIDRAWFDSSSIIYAECIDKKDTLKTVTIVFKSGRTYLYNGVNVNDWLMFREAKSQGKALNQYIAKKNPLTKEPIYQYKRLEDSDVSIYEKQINDFSKIENTVKAYTESEFIESCKNNGYGDTAERLIEILKKLASEKNCTESITIVFDKNP